MIVLDASAAIELLLGTSGFDVVADRLSTDAGGAHAPHLIDVEVLHTLRRLTLTGDISGVEATEALDVFGAITIERYPHGPLTERCWELRANHSAYDAVYLALTEALDADLITSDTKLASARLRAGRVVLTT